MSEMSNRAEFLFLSYVNRSGSTYLANLLSCSPKVCACPEAEILISLFLRDPMKKVSKKDIQFVGDLLKRDIKFSSWGINDKVGNVLSRRGIRNYEVFEDILMIYRDTVKPDANIILFKGTRIIELYEEYLKASHSNSKLIYIYRDPRAVFLSQKSSFVFNSRMNTNPLVVVKQWRKFLCVSLRLKRKFPDKVLRVRYEDLIKSHPIILGSISKFLETDLSNLSSSEKLSRKIPYWQKSLHTRVDDAPDISRIDRWGDRLKEWELAFIEKLLRENLVKEGYVLLGKKIGSVKLFFYYTYLSIRMDFLIVKRFVISCMVEFITRFHLWRFIRVFKKGNDLNYSREIN